jgi:hypothetical protein
VRDRCNVRQPAKSDLASIAATGFGLTALCIGEKRGYVSHAEARIRAANTLRFLWKKMQDHRGFFYHFANVNNGERLWDSEVSSVDTAILLSRTTAYLGVPQRFQSYWKYVDTVEVCGSSPHGPTILFLSFRWA